MAFSVTETAAVYSLAGSAIYAATGDGAGHLVIVGPGNPVYSNDDGATWAAGTRPSGPYADFFAVGYGADRYVAVEGSSAVAMWSADHGATWTGATLPHAADWRSVVHTGERFVAAAGSYYQSSTSYMAYSDDGGETWVSVSPPDAWEIIAESLTWCGSFGIVLSKAGNAVYKTTDGVTWTKHTTSHSPDILRLAWTGSLIVGLVYGAASAQTSPDGLAWTARTLPAALNWTQVAWNGVRLFALGGDSNSATYLTSFDGITFTAGAMPASRYWEGLGVSGTTIMALNPGARRIGLGTGDVTLMTGAAELALNIHAVGQGTAELPLSIHAIATGNAELALRVSFIDPDVLSGNAPVTDGEEAAVFGPIVMINGVDMTDLCVGDIVIEAEEGTARIADFVVELPPGSVYLPNWTGRLVVISIADMKTGTPLNAMQLFEGKVDVPTIDLDSGQISLRCTDDLQNAINRMSREQIDTLLGGYWSSAIFDPGAGAFAYFNDRASTVAASVDRSPYGAIRKTAWAAKTVPDLIFDEDSILDESLNVEMAERNEIINEVNVEFGYRVPKAKSEGYLCSYDIMAANNTSFAFWVRDGGAFLVREQIVSAIEAAGGTVDSIDYIPLPTSAVVIPAIGGGTAGAWLPDPVNDPKNCQGFSAVVSFDYAQFVDETHKIKVHAPKSIESVGVLTNSMSGSLEGKTIDVVANETAAFLFKLSLSKIPPSATATVVPGFTAAQTAALTADTDRAAANGAIETLIAVAKVLIAARHRGSILPFSVALNPVVDVSKTIEVNTARINARGKVKRLKHIISTDTAEATTEVGIAISGIAGLGIAHPDDAVTSVTADDDGATTLLGPAIVTWNGASGGDQVISVTFPGVEDAEREKATLVFERTVAAAIAEDLFTITI